MLASLLPSLRKILKFREFELASLEHLFQMHGPRF